MHPKVLLELLEKWAEWEPKAPALALVLGPDLERFHHYRRSYRRSSTTRSWRSSRMHSLLSGRSSVPRLLLKNSQTAIGRRCRCRHLCR